MPPGANGLTGPAYCRWKAEQRWKRAVAKLGQPITAPDVSGLGPCGKCGTTDIATHGWLGFPDSGTCVPCAETAEAERKMASAWTTLPTPQDDRESLITALLDVHDVYEKLNGASPPARVLPELLSQWHPDVAGGTLSYQTLQRKLKAALAARERAKGPPTQRPPWTEAH